jgi:hypothetical protein
LKKINDFIGTPTRNLRACSTAPQPSALSRAPLYPLKIETAGPSELLVTIYHTAHHHIPEEGNFLLCKDARIVMTDLSEVLADVTGPYHVLTRS